MAYFYHWLFGKHTKKDAQELSWSWVFLQRQSLSIDSVIGCQRGRVTEPWQWEWANCRFPSERLLPRYTPRHSRHTVGPSTSWSWLLIQLMITPVQCRQKIQWETQWKSTPSNQPHWHENELNGKECDIVVVVGSMEGWCHYQIYCCCCC